MQNSRFPPSPIFSPIAGKNKRGERQIPINSYVTPKKDVSFLSSTRHSITKSSPRYSLSQATTPKLQTKHHAKHNGPLLASTQFNVNLGTYTDVKSPGLTSRIVQYNNEQTSEKPVPTHQPKYGSPGLFPVVHFFKKSLPVITPKQNKITMKMATPDYYYNGNNSAFYHESNTSLRSDVSESDINTKSVLDALKEISRKRIHVSEEFEIDTESSKKTKRQEYNLNEFSKRNREDSPTQADATSPSSIQTTKRMCIVDPVYASSTSYQMFVDKGTKRKTKATEDIVIENQQKLIKLSNAGTQTMPVAEKPITTVEPDKVDIRDKTDDSKDEIDTPNDTAKVDTNVILQIFDEAPLEIHKKNKLAAVLGAITGEKPVLIPFKKEEPEPEKDDKLISILSPKNKSKHDKHVHFGANSTAIFNNTTEDNSSKSISKDTEILLNNTHLPVSTQADLQTLSVVSVTSTNVETSIALTTNMSSSSTANNFSGGGGFKFDLSPKPKSENSMFTLNKISSTSDVPKMTFTLPINAGTKNETIAVTTNNSTDNTITISSAKSIFSSPNTVSATYTTPNVTLGTINAVTATSTSNTNTKHLFGNIPIPSTQKNDTILTSTSSLITNSTPVINSVCTSKPSTAIFNGNITSTINKGGFSFGTTVSKVNTTSFDAKTTSATSAFSTQTSTFNTPSTLTVPAGGFDTTFGKQSANSTFGSATNPLPPFGVTTSSSPTFGTGTTTNPNFGTEKSLSFVATAATTLATASAPTFGVQSTSAEFGTTTTSTFASTTFGNPIPFANANASNNTFGAPVPTSTFGATSAPAPTPGFGTTAGFGIVTTTPSFGTTATSSFGGVTTTTTFGSSAPTFGVAPSNIISGSFGTSSTIAQSGFGVNTTTTSTFGAPVSSASVFGFGPKTSAPAATTSAFNFGATTAATPSFGSSPAPSFGTTPTSSFGTSKPGFGGSFGGTPGFSNPTSTQSSSFSFGDKNTFGGAAPTTTASGFGTTPNSTPPIFAFGGGSANNNSANNFGKPATNGTFNFNAPTNAAPAFGNNQPAFGSTPTTQPAFGTPTPSSFGNASAPGFVAPASGGFGAPKTTANAFGATNTPTFGSSNTTAAVPAFGAASSSFPTANSTFGNTAPPSTFGAGNGFGTNNFNTASGFGGSGDALKQQSTSFNNNSTTNFSFNGNNNVTAPAAQANSTFAFGATSPPKPGGVFSFGSGGAPNETPKQGSFNFTAGTATPNFGNVASPPAFGAQNFQAFNATSPQFNSPAAGGAMFSIGSGSSAKQRTQLKAKRRT